MGGFYAPLYKTKLHLLNLSVCPSFHRKDIGTQMVNKLFSKLSKDRRSRITVEIRETNLAAQMFFKNLGFRAFSVLRDRYNDTDEDTYVMQYWFKNDNVENVPVNRIYNLNFPVDYENE
jgi:[ribosomal protein S18]-alanine N-acetyltransferase